MRLFRISNFLSLVVATAFGVLLFWTSQAVQQKEDQLGELKNNLAQETETVRVLGVEWDYLNRPQRLEKMAVEHLGMELPSATEVVKQVKDIPEPSPLIIPYNPELAQEVSAQVPAKPPQQKSIPLKAETISPSKADKQSFDKLIQSLDGGTDE
jgi:cell division protein FtsL